MTDNTSGEAGAPGEDQGESPPTTPWFPPASWPGSQHGPPHGPGQFGSAGYGQPPYGGWPQHPVAPKPGVIPLRPLGVGEILDGAFTTIRRNPRATLGLSAIVLTISGVLGAVAAMWLSSSLGPLPAVGEQLSHAQAHQLLVRLADFGLPLLGATYALGFLVDVMLAGVLTAVIGRTVLGHDITAGEAWRIARPRLPVLLGVTLLRLVIGPALLLVCGVLLVILAAANTPPGLVALIGVPCFLAAIYVSILAWFRFRLAGPVVVLERLGPIGALGRSWRLVKGSFWRVLGIMVLTAVIVLVTAGILQVPFRELAAVLGGGSPMPGPLLPTVTASIASVIVAATGGIVAGTLTRPVKAGVAILLYADLRMRKEGLDLVLQTAAADGATPTGDELASVWRPGVPGAYRPAPPAHSQAPYPHGAWARAAPPGQGGAPPTW